MKKVSTKNLVEIPAYKTLNIGRVKVFPVGLSHSIPDNLGYAIYTKDGVIFYASDFVFDAMMRGHYQTDMGKLAYIGKQGVLCLMAESVYANKVGHTSPNHRISSLIRETLSKAEGRIIFNVLSSHLYRIQELFNEVSKTDRKIIIMGKKLQSIVEYATQNNYLFVDPKCIGDLSNINDPDVVIVNSNDRERPYSTIYKIVNGYDKFVKLKPSDTVFLATPIYEGREKTFYKLLDDISKLDVEVVTLSKENLSHHASSEDLMMMMDLMKPKYYFPIKGEYRHQVANANLAMQVGIPANHIILKENGFVASFVNGKLNENDFSKIPCGDISIDGDSSDDIGEECYQIMELLLFLLLYQRRQKRLLLGQKF